MKNGTESNNIELKTHETLLRNALYMQLYDIIYSRIADGQYSEGTYIPNEYELTREFGVSIGTIRKAIDLLVKDNLLLRQQGKGTMVSNRQTADFKMGLGRFKRKIGGELVKLKIKLFNVRQEQCSEEISRKINAEPDEEFVEVEVHESSEDEDVVFLRKTYITKKRFSDIDIGKFELSDPLMFLNRNGHHVGKTEGRLTIIIATQAIADLCGIEKGTPLLGIERLLYEKRGYLLSYTIGQCYMANGNYFVWSH